jgi:hypothetical protein
MRELIHNGVEWRVHETSAGHVPGSRRNRCLIFDSEGVVRRLWEYPDSWQELSDDDLWHLADDSARVPQSPARDRPPVGPPGHPAIAAATEAAARARALLTELAIDRQANQAVRDHREMLLDACRLSRDQVRIAVQAYAVSLKNDGVPPERTVLLIKTAMKAGFDSSECSDVDVEQLFGEGVTWGIRAYFAA